MFTAFALLVFVASCQAVCDKKCDVPIKHYEELGCEPVYANPGDCCPKHFDCSKMQGRSTASCYLNGKTYNHGDRVPDEDTGSMCAASCFCSKNEWKDFNCANIECPSLFGVTVKPGCRSTYKDGDCCSSGTICEPFTGLAKCEIDGKTYYEGEKMYPQSDECQVCLCKPGFKGKLEEPFCKPVNCGTELRNSVSARQNYGPIFYGDSKCCTIGWQSPEQIVKIHPGKNASGDQKCKFGEKELNIGDKVELKKDSSYSPDINCECKIPPLVTCIQKPYDPST